MKKSDELKDKASKEDNDLKALQLYNKARREKRLETFEEILPLLHNKQYIVIEHNFKYTIDTWTQFGIIDFFPKSNKLLIRKDNKWITNGIKWIRHNLLK